MDRLFYHAPLLFDASETALLFHSDILRQPLPTANQNLHSFLSDLVVRVKSTSLPGLEQQLRTQINIGLFENEVTLKQVSRRVGIHPRTLNSRLKNEGTSFQKIRNDVRKDTAENLLRNTGMSIVEIAALLGYADSSSFNHAFSRWFGTGPKNWREMQASA